MNLSILVIIVVAIGYNIDHASGKKVTTAKAVIETLVQTSGSLTQFLNKLEDVFLIPITKQIDLEIKRMPTDIEGITPEENKLVMNAHQALYESRFDITRTRALLVALAAETSITAKEIVVGLQKFLSDTDDQLKRDDIKDVVDKMERMLLRSKMIIRQAQAKYVSVARQLDVVQVKLGVFGKKMRQLADRSGKRFREYASHMRKIVYGSVSAACLYFPPSCVPAFATAATILEKKLAAHGRKVDSLKITCYRSKRSADKVVGKVKQDIATLEDENSVIDQWKSNIVLVYEDFVGGGYLEVAADMQDFISNYAVDKMNGLEKVAVDFMEKCKTTIE